MSYEELDRVRVIERVEDDVNGAIAPAVAEAIEDPAIGGLREAGGGDRRPSHIST